MLGSRNVLLDTALAFARRGIPVTPAWTAVKDRTGRARWPRRAAWICGCGDRGCRTPGAHPSTRAQVLEIEAITATWGAAQAPNLMISSSDTLAIWSVPRDRRVWHEAAGAATPGGVASGDAAAGRELDLLHLTHRPRAGADRRSGRRGRAARSPVPDTGTALTAPGRQGALVVVTAVPRRAVAGCWPGTRSSRASRRSARPDAGQRP